VQLKVPSGGVYLDLRTEGAGNLQIIRGTFKGRGEGKKKNSSPWKEKEKKIEMVFQ